MSNIQYLSTYLLDSVRISGSAIPDLSSYESSTPCYFIGSKDAFQFIENTEYTIAFNLVGLSNGVIDGRMDVYMVASGSGSNPFYTYDPYGLWLGTYAIENGQTRVEFLEQELNFVPPIGGLGYLRFVIYGGEWNLSNIEIFTSTETGFNPDSAKLIIPIHSRRYETLKFKAEFFDPTNTIIPVEVESDNIFFDGGNLVIRGQDARLYGRLTLTPSGSGPVLVQDPSGSYVGILDIADESSVPRPVYYADVNTYSGPSLVTMYSGSTPYSASAEGPAIGFQVFGFSASEASYLDFNTSTGRLTIRGDIIFLPGTETSESIVSGSGLAALQRLVYGSSATDFPSATFIKNNIIYSPQIAGNIGYISESFGVGDIVNNRGIVLTARGYKSGSVYYPDRPAVYIGGASETGAFASSSTPVFFASSSYGGLFSLGANFYVQPVGQTPELVISGSTVRMYLQTASISIPNKIDINTTTAAPYISLGAAGSSSGIGVWLDGTGTFRASSNLTGSGFLYDAATNTVNIVNANINYGTVTRLRISDLEQDSSIIDSSGSAISVVKTRDLHVSESAIFFGTPGTYGSASVNTDVPHLIVYSGSSTSTVLEIGTYTRDVSSTGSSAREISIPLDDSGSLVGNYGGFKIWLSSENNFSTGSGNFYSGIQENAVKVSGEVRIVEDNEVIPSYKTDYEVWVSASWFSDYSSGIFTQIDDGTIFVTTNGIYTQMYNNKTVTLPAPANSGSVYVKVYTYLSASQTIVY